MTLADVAAALAAEGTVMTIVNRKDGGWQVSTCQRGGSGWQIFFGDTLDETVSRALSGPTTDEDPFA